MEVEALDWSGISEFYYDEMVKKKEPADGSCFFHCIADAFYRPYQIGSVNKEKFVRQMRHQLALLLESKNDDGILWYRTLSRGKLEELSRGIPALSLENMKKSLDSSESVDNRFNEYVSNVF